jgi:uncharacterized protein (UPF0264 family)
MGCEILLLDTYDKSCGGLLRWLNVPQLEDVLDVAHSLCMRVALAGSLTAAELSDLCDLHVDLFAVRGAACEGGRDGQVSQVAIEALQKALVNMPPATKSRRRNGGFGERSIVKSW